MKSKQISISHPTYAKGGSKGMAKKGTVVKQEPGVSHVAGSKAPNRVSGGSGHMAGEQSVTKSKPA